MRRFKARHCGLVIGPLTGDINGMSNVTKAIAAKLVRKGFATQDTGANRNSGRILYNLSRIWKNGLAVYAILINRHVSTRNIYSVVNDGLGVYYTLAICWAARVCGSTLYLHHHSWKYISTFNRSINRLVIKYPDVIHIFLCSKMRDEFQEKYGSTKSAVLSNRSLFCSPEPKPVKNQNKLTVGHISNLSIEKGLNYVLEFAHRMNDRPEKIELLLAGPSDINTQSEIERTLSKLKNSKFLGSVYGARKNAFYQEIDVLLFPSSYPTEAEALVLYEAQANGVFIITSKFGCSDSQVQDGDLVVRDLSNFTDQAEKKCLDLYEVRESLIKLREKRQSHFLSLAKSQCKIMEELLTEMTK